MLWCEEEEEETLKILLLWRDEVICQAFMAGQNSFLFTKQDATITVTFNQILYFFNIVGYYSGTT